MRAERKSETGSHPRCQNPLRFHAVGARRQENIRIIRPLGAQGAPNHVPVLAAGRSPAADGGGRLSNAPMRMLEVVPLERKGRAKTQPIVAPLGRPSPGGGHMCPRRAPWAPCMPRARLAGTTGWGEAWARARGGAWAPSPGACPAISLEASTSGRFRRELAPQTAPLRRVESNGCPPASTRAEPHVGSLSQLRDAYSVSDDACILSRSRSRAAVEGYGDLGLRKNSGGHSYEGPHEAATEAR